MSSERKKLRILVLSEDKRTERFFRRLLHVLGFETRRVRFQTAPKGKGAGEAWVARRKQELDRALEGGGLVVRQAHERIATPVPTRSIETWLFALLNNPGLDEATDYKHRFEQEYRAHEMDVLRNAATAWKDVDRASLPSLADGRAELKRIDP